MRVETRLFGTIEVNEDKIITFSEGIIGFPFMKNFTLIKDEEDEEATIMWLQSLEETQYALPVMVPTLLFDDYDPIVEDEAIAGLGELTEKNTYALVTLTVPSDIEKITANLKAPIIVNMDTLKARQLIVEDDYQVKHPIYELLKQKKEGV